MNNIWIIEFIEGESWIPRWTDSGTKEEVEAKILDKIIWLAFYDKLPFYFKCLTDEMQLNKEKIRIIKYNE